MSQSTFHRFGDLPQELQMQIWSYAAAPAGPLRLDAELFLSIGGYDESGGYPNPAKEPNHCRFFMYTSPLLIGPSCAEYVHRGVARETVMDRLSLLSTCRMARQMGLEEWRKDIERVNMFVYASESAEFAEGMQIRVMDLLDDLLKATKHSKAKALPSRPHPNAAEGDQSEGSPRDVSQSLNLAELDLNRAQGEGSRSARRRRRRKEREAQRVRDSRLGVPGAIISADT